MLFFNSTHLGLGCVWLHGKCETWELLFNCLVDICISELGFELVVINSHIENDK